MTDVDRVLSEVLDEELAYWTPSRSGEITTNLIEALGQRGYAIMRVEPWAGTPERVTPERVEVPAVGRYPCTCGQRYGCIAHPFGPPRVAESTPPPPDPPNH